MWDLRAKKCVRLLRGAHANHTHRIGIAFSPCLRYIACGSEDCAAHIYELAGGRPIARLKGHKEVVIDVSWNPRHPQIATTSFDGTVRFYTEVDHY